MGICGNRNRSTKGSLGAIDITLLHQFATE
jgi:hypothetical protein